METAKEYCKRLDNELGEWWSNDYDELPKRMQEYAVCGEPVCILNVGRDG